MLMLRFISYSTAAQGPIYLHLKNGGYAGLIASILEEA